MSVNGIMLSSAFYRANDVLTISRELLGLRLCRKQSDGSITSGLIIETEAYRWYGDKANHASGGRKTQRTDTMFKDGGISYIYLCYGIHHLFNVVTNEAGKPDAVLVRAIKPDNGIDTMLANRNMLQIKPQMTNGPGKLSQALSIDLSLNGESLTGNKLWIEKTNISYNENDIIACKRVGIDYAGRDARKPWRFILAGYSNWASTQIPYSPS